jgi:DHA2 family multidrug resistance protein
MAAIAHEIARQAQMIAFNDLFWFIGWITFALLPLLLLMKRPEKVGLALA